MLALRCEGGDECTVQRCMERVRFLQFVLLTRASCSPKLLWWRAVDVFMLFMRKGAGWKGTRVTGTSIASAPPECQYMIYLKLRPTHKNFPRARFVAPCNLQWYHTTYAQDGTYLERLRRALFDDNSHHHMAVRRMGMTACMPGTSRLPCLHFIVPTGSVLARASWLARLVTAAGRSSSNALEGSQATMIGGGGRRRQRQAHGQRRGRGMTMCPPRVLLVMVAGLLLLGVR
jgi:hypothetical protein